MSNRWLVAICAAVAASLALATASQTYVSMLSHGHSFVRLLTWQLVCWTPWAIMAPWLVRTATRYRALKLVVIAVGITVLQGALSATSATVLQPFSPVVDLAFRPALGGAGWFIVLVNPLTCLLLIIGGRALAAYESAKGLEAREAHLQIELSRAQLDALRLEIQPHFLFNTLNAVAALIRANDNPAALEMLIGLSSLMRATLDQPLAQTAPLADELQLIRQYVDLQRARFGDRLRVRWEISPACESFLIPVLLLQPIVENAFRHGLGPRAQEGELVIGAALRHGSLHLTVTDNGVGLPPQFALATNAGTGLRNTQARLERLYHGAASLRLTPVATGGTRVDITVPSDCAPQAIATSHVA